MLAAIGLFAVAGFQLLLAAGAPLGFAAWGGRHPERLPARLRWASAVSAIVLVLAGWVVLAKGGAVTRTPLPVAWLTAATWVVAALVGLSGMANMASETRWERYLWGPVAVIIAGATAVVALSSGPR